MNRVWLREYVFDLKKLVATSIFLDVDVKGLNVSISPFLTKGL